EARLLARDDRDRPPIDEQPGGLARARRRLAALLLARDDRGDLVAPAIVRLRACDRVRPRGAVGGIAGKERRDRSEVVGVIRREPADPRKAADIDRDAHGRSIRCGMFGGGVDLHQNAYCLRASRGLSSMRTRYSIDVTALRRTTEGAGFRAPGRKRATMKPPSLRRSSLNTEAAGA